MTEESTQSQPIIGLTTKLRVAGNVDMAPITDGLTRVMMSGARFPGFWSAEIIPPSLARAEWTLVERFRNYEQANAWMHSNTRKELLEELRSVVPGRILSSEEILDDKGDHGHAATAIVTYVKPGMESDYWNWEAKIQSAQAKFPGYRGTYIQPPPPDSPGKWTTMLRFDTPETLDAWIASSIRKDLLAESESLVNATVFQDMSSSFPGFFPADKRGQSPGSWKTACLILVALYPFLCLFRMILGPALAGLDPSLTNIIILTLSVAMLSWGCMPLLVRVFRWWLLPEPINQTRVNLSGGLLMLLILAVELFLFWNQH